MNMTPEHRRFLLIEQATAGAAINLGIAALLGWLLFRHAAILPIAGSRGVMMDTITSAFMIPFATCLILTRFVRAQVRRGRIPVLNGGALSRLVPRCIMWRAILLGFVCAAAIVPIMTAACAVLGLTSVPLGYFLIFKLIFASAEGALLTPAIAFVAISRQDHT